MAGTQLDRGGLMPFRDTMRSIRTLLLLLSVVFASIPGIAAETRSRVFAETRAIFRVGAGVRVCTISPQPISSSKPVRLVIYALPNGSTIEHALGRPVPAGANSPYGEQHIAAQMRFLREKAEPNAVLACVEAPGLAWPAWRKRGGDGRIVQIVNSLAARVGASRVSLTGHSGGGSFLFGYIHAVAEIPPQVDRIAFLDATYGYETDRHASKLAHWIKASRDHRLAVLAYRDDRALYKGKTFIRAGTGTAARSRQMQADLDGWFSFWPWQKQDIASAKAAGGRIQIAIHQNSRGERLHMAVVGRNGFIHANLTGIRRENRGYRWMGEPAYGACISE